MKQKILVTGVAGFIGYHLSKKLLEKGYEVVGIDNLNNYYSIELKHSRLANLISNSNFAFKEYDLVNKSKLFHLFEEKKPEIVINLAAQAGVRYSIENPSAYIDSNIVGFQNILEACRNYPVKHLLFASSSSVYGANKKIPFSENDNVDHPVSLYAATKKSNELVAHTYSNLYNIPVSGLRFFTVYGEWGRPDMAYFLFTKAILENKPIDIFNNGDMERDFTYVDDVINGIIVLMEKNPQKNSRWDYLKSEPSTSFAPYEIYNIGNNTPVKLLDFVTVLENLIGKKAIKNFLPMQPGDVKTTFADIDKLTNAVGYNPTTSIEIGLEKFVSWYKNYYKI